MEQENRELKSLIEQLQNKSSPKRRSAAKKIRKIKDAAAGPGLVQALTKEIQDPRTWETQYQIIMAIADSNYCEAIPLLNDIAKIELDATMVHIATGDAITNLEYHSTNKIEMLPTWINLDKKPLVEGGIRALAMNKITPDNDLIQRIINYVEKPDNSYMDFWVAAASPGWPINLTKPFLNRCIKKSALEDTKKAAKAALEGKYLKWKPL